MPASHASASQSRQCLCLCLCSREDWALGPFDLLAVALDWTLEIELVCLDRDGVTGLG